MSGRQDTGGLATALAMLGAAGATSVNEDQPDMFEADAPLSLPEATKPERTGKAGRPPGARNKSTDEWVSYFLGRYRSPLTALAELYSRPLEALVDDLQAMADKHKSWIETKDGGRWERVAISPLDVLKMQRDAATALLPYIHKKQPLDLQVDMRRPGIVVVGDLNVAGAIGEDDVALPLPQIVENQRVIEVDPMKSDGQSSDDEGKH